MPGDNGTVSFAAERLVDWGVARATGARVTGSGPLLPSIERAQLSEDFAEVVPEAESMVSSFTGLHAETGRTRPWVMSRRQWIDANLRGFERILDPFARTVLGDRPDGPLAGARRATLGVQIGGLLGYLGRRVLGQYDVFLPPDDEGLIYFVGPNVAALERRFGFPEREFRLWLSLHEVAHRVQFGGTPWLRGYLATMLEDYLGALELVMNHVAGDRVPEAPAFHRTLTERRTRRGMEKMFQKAIGFDAKTAQYGMGERFVNEVVDRVGMEGFNRVWERADHLPSLAEIQSPEAWVARVAAA